MPTEDAYSSKPIVLANSGLAYVRMLIPVSPKLVMFPVPFYLLPKFCDGIQPEFLRYTAGVGHGVIGCVLIRYIRGPINAWRVEASVGVFLTEVEAVLGVPPVAALGPGQFQSERGEHVVERPAEDDVVVAVQKEHDYCGGYAYTWNENMYMK